MAISAINEPSNQHYPSIQLNSSVEALLSLFDFFFSVYLRAFSRSAQSILTRYLQHPRVSQSPAKRS
jgi:hypothetical protein